VIITAAISGADYGKFGKIGDMLLIAIVGMLAVQTYIVILAIDIKIRTRPRKVIAKTLVTLIAGTIWGVVLRSLNSGMMTVGVLIGAVIAASISRLLPWTRPDLLPREIETKHFHIYTDLEPDSARFYADFFEGFTVYFKKYYFDFHQNQRLTVYLFSTTLRYELHNRKSRGPSTPYGYYCGPEENLIVVNLASGLGTATHELVHHFVAKGFTRETCPQWVNEGFAMFFEKFIAYFDTQGKLMISLGYYSNWRFPQTKRLIKKIRFADLTNYRYDSPIRDFMLFLHRKGLLEKFINRMIERRGDPTGKVTLQTVCRKDIPTMVDEWKAWVRSQPIDGNVRLVKQAFVKTAKEWESWQRANRGKIHWDERLHIYVVGKPPANEVDS